MQRTVLNQTYFQKTCQFSDNLTTVLSESPSSMILRFASRRPKQPNPTDLGKDEANAPQKTRQIVKQQEKVLKLFEDSVKLAQKTIKFIISCREVTYKIAMGLQQIYRQDII